MTKTKLGIVSTIIWVIGFFFIVVLKWTELISLSLNELGDFLAGAFAPVAFFWLIIGYFQQGDELKLNTQALLAQEKEMEKLVKQYSRQAKASEESNKVKQLEIDNNINREREAAAPKLVITVLSAGSNKRKYSIVNGGGTVTNLRIDIHDPFKAKITPSNILKKDEQSQLTIYNTDSSSEGEFTIYCDDVKNNKHANSFTFSINDNPIPVS